MMEPRILEAKEAAKHNTFFRKVLFTAEKSQLVVMSLLPGEEIGLEIHNGDQLLYAVKGEGVAVINESREPFEKGAILCVPAGAPHDVINTGERPLKLFTIYAPRFGFVVVRTQSYLPKRGADFEQVLISTASR